MSRMMEFWKKNRIFIITLFISVFLINLCARMFMPSDEPPAGMQVVQSDNYGDARDKDLKIITGEDVRVNAPVEKKRGNSFLQLLLLAMALILIAKYGFRKGWFSHLLPKVVILRISLHRKRSNARLLMRISVYNNTPQSKTFSAPHLFFKRGKDTRNFAVKNELFPLTLPTGSSHSILIDVDQFWEKVAGLNLYNRIGASIETSTGESYRSLAIPKWLVLGKVG